MPVAPVVNGAMQVTNAELAKITGSTFLVEGVGTKNAVLIPLTGIDGKAITSGQKILLSKNVAIEGLTKAGKAGVAAKTATVGNVTVMGKTGAAAKAGMGIAAVKLVEIEGAGTVVGTGQNVGLTGLEIRGILQPGPNGTEVIFNGGEAKLTIKSAVAKAKVKGGAVLAKGAGAVTKGAGTVVNQAPSVANGAAGAAGAAGAGSSVGSVAGSSAAKAAAAGTIWKGTGLSLGLGLGLGAWGPVLLAGVVAAAGVGVYSYMKRKA